MNPAEYEGIIVDKWTGHSNSETGSDVYFRLLVEQENQQRMVVNVDGEIFNRAQIGGTIKKT